METEPFTLHLGNHEVYLRGVLAFGSKEVEVYLYEDEAGFGARGEHWTPFDRPDHESDQALIEALCAALRTFFS